MRQATHEEGQAIWESLLLHSKHGRTAHGDIQWIADQLQFGRKVVSRIWHQGIESMGLRQAAVVMSRARARGRKKVDRVELYQRILEVPVADRNNTLTLQLATNTSCYLIQQLLKEGYLRRALKQTRPLLSDKHKVDRMKFCAEHVRQDTDGSHYFDPLLDVVHIDEKWFYTKKVGQKVYILTGKDDTPDEEPPVQYVQSKRHIIKVMFLCAVARPRAGWDGKVGMWPVVKEYVTQRATVNRGAGVIELKPVVMTREIARNMLVEIVIPAIKEKWPRHQMFNPIKIQQDNARPHVGVSDPEVVAAGQSGGWQISPTNQPAQSPELNVEHGLLQQHPVSAVTNGAAHNCGSHPRSAPGIRRDTGHNAQQDFCDSAAHDAAHYAPWRGKRFSHHPLQEGSFAAEGKLPMSLPCEAQLYYDTLAAVAQSPE